MRQKALDAAIELAASSGTAQFTLDAVAARAEISKGGLQHHFKSKTALLEAMVGRVIETFDEELKRATGDRTATQKGGNPLTVYLERSFSGLGARMPTAQVVLAVQAYDPKLLTPLRSYFRERIRELSAHYGDQLGQVLALMLVADGLWIFDAIGSAPFEPAERQRTLDAALQWARAVQPAAKPRTLRDPG